MKKREELDTLREQVGGVIVVVIPPPTAVIPLWPQKDILSFFQPNTVYIPP